MTRGETLRSKSDASCLVNTAGVLRNNVDTYAETMTLEMGKPISEARGEIEKCAWVCEFYAENAERFLADEVIETDASESFVNHDPIGTVLATFSKRFGQMCIDT